jgi:hypothetical protein
MARLFFASFWMIVFTGAVRKWLFPGTSIFYLLQDIPIGFAYIYAIWKGCFDRSYLLLGIIFLSTILILQGLAQIIVSGLNIFVAAVGFHHYLFYLPILLVFPLCLTAKYRKDFVKWNLLFSIPMFLLAIAQAISPKSAWVNKTSEGDAFGVAGSDVARVSGTFNFTGFYGLWVAIAVALCIGEWLLPKERRAIRSPWLMILCTFTVNLCHLVSASRTAIALAGMAILGGVVCAVILGSVRAILAVGGICVLIPIAVGMTYVISPAEFDIVLERFSGHSYVQEGTNRVEEGLIGFMTDPPFSLIGAGIGMGVDAAHIGSVDAYNFTYALSENDTIRNVMELGTPVGLLYTLTRLSFLFGMVFLSIWIARTGSSPHVLPLSFCLLTQGYQGDLTRNAAMTCSQVMMGYAFILGAYYYPDNTTSLQFMADDSSTRSV